MQPLFTSHCAGCHSAASPAAGLALDAGAYTSLCGEGTSCTPVKSTKHLTLNRIEPNNTANSFLYLKVTGNLPPATECMNNDCGSAMPPSSCGDCMPLTPEELQTLADWIDEGAQNL